MRTETVEGFLARLSRVPPSGGGAGAALHAAHGAALVAMVATDGGGGRTSGSAADVRTKARERADELRELALGLATEAESAADPVAGPAATADPDDEAGLLGTGRLAVRVIEVTEQALTLAETLRPLGDRAALPGVAAAAEILRAAAGTARVTVETALAGLADPAAREELFEAVDHVDDLVLRAAKVTAAVREQLVR